MASAPLSVLIVEDEAVLAMDLAMMLEDAHQSVIGEAASLNQVLALPDEPAIDLAFVDVQLLDGSSGVDAAEVLRLRHPAITIVFVTANPRKVPAGAAGAIGYISKPFTRAGMMQAIGWIAAAIHNEAPPAQRPSCFVALDAGRPEFA